MGAFRVALLLVLLCLAEAADEPQREAQPVIHSAKPTIQTFFGCFLSGVVFALVMMNWLGLFPWERFMPASRTLAKTKAMVEQAASTGIFPSVLTTEEFKMVLVVRNDLKMGKGKIGAQCGHAVLGAYRRAEKTKNPYMKKWLSEGQRKVVVKDESEESVLRLRETAEKSGLNTYIVCDAGRTQIEAGTLTVLAIGPAPETILDSVTGHLKLL